MVTWPSSKGWCMVVRTLRLNFGQFVQKQDAVVVQQGGGDQL